MREGSKQELAYKLCQESPLFSVAKRHEKERLQGFRDYTEFTIGRV